MKKTSGGISVFTVLTIVFVVMKLIPDNDVYKNWPWFSFNPFIGSVFMFLITWPLFVLIIIGAMYLLFKMVDYIGK